MSEINSLFYSLFFSLAHTFHSSHVSHSHSSHVSHSHSSSHIPGLIVYSYCFREGTTLETRDVQLALEKIWDMRLPGVGDSTTELKQIRKAAAGTTEAHRHRMQAVRKSQASNR